MTARQSILHEECQDCDAQLLLHRQGETHCSCGDEWPCPELAAELAAVKTAIAEHCHEMLDSRRDVFVIGPQTFAAAVWRDPENERTPCPDVGHPNGDSRVVSAAAVHRVLDWAENDWPMSLGDFLSGMFFGRAWDQKTPPWRLIPEAKDRLSAESLGLDHLYPKKEPQP